MKQRSTEHSGVNCPGFQARGLKIRLSFIRPTGIVDKFGMATMAGAGLSLLVTGSLLGS